MEALSLSYRSPVSILRSPRLLSALSDERLVAELRNGNRAAFEALYDRHHRGLVSFCWHMLGSQQEAEDAVQQSFLSAYHHIVTRDQHLEVKAWLYKIARNRCLSVLRARREQPSDAIEASGPPLGEEAEQRAELRELLADLREVPEEQRAALVLSELRGLSHAEIGGVLGCDTSRVKSLVFQARCGLIGKREARNMHCGEVRRQLASARGAALRRRELRDHVRTCAGCAHFREQVRRQRRMLALVLPVAPSAALKHRILSDVGLCGSGTGAGGAGLGAASLAGAGKLLAMGVVGSVVVLGAIGIFGGTEDPALGGPPPARGASVGRHFAAAPAPGRGLFGWWPVAGDWPGAAARGAEARAPSDGQTIAGRLTRTVHSHAQRAGAYAGGAGSARRTRRHGGGGSGSGTAGSGSGTGGSGSGTGGHGSGRHPGGGSTRTTGTSGTGRGGGTSSGPGSTRGGSHGQGRAVGHSRAPGSRARGIAGTRAGGGDRGEHGRAWARTRGRGRKYGLYKPRGEPATPHRR